MKKAAGRAGGLGAGRWKQQSIQPPHCRGWGRGQEGPKSRAQYQMRAWEDPKSGLAASLQVKQTQPNRSTVCLTCSSPRKVMRSVDVHSQNFGHKTVSSQLGGQTKGVGQRNAGAYRKALTYRARRLGRVRLKGTHKGSMLPSKASVMSFPPVPPPSSTIRCQENKPLI